MGSFHQRKWSDNKQYAVEVRWGIFIVSLTYFFIPWSGGKYSHRNSYNFAMTVIAQDYHLTAGAWAACAWRGSSFVAWWKKFDGHKSNKKKSHSTIKRSKKLFSWAQMNTLCKIRVGISNRLSHRDQADMSVLGTRLINLRWRN